MKDSLWSRVGFWLERFDVLHPLLLRSLNLPAASGGWLYENRINRHVVIKRGRA